MDTSAADKIQQPFATVFGGAGLIGRDSGRRISLQHYVVSFLLTDCALLFVVGLLPLVWQSLGAANFVEAIASRAEAQALIVGVAVFLVCQKMVGGYQTDRVTTASHSIRTLLLALLLTFFFLMALATAGKVTHVYSRFWFFSWFTSAVSLLPVTRAFAIERLRRRLASGDYVYRALSVGLFSAPLKAADISRVSHGLTRAGVPLAFASFADLARLEEAVREHEVDDVYITVPWQQAPQVFRALRQLRHLSANVYVLPSEDLAGTKLLGARMRDDRLQMHVVDRPIEGWNYWQKRLSDVVGASLGLIVAAPVMLLVAAAIRIESPGPVLFRQARLGFNGRRFEVLKFRSMYHDQSDAGAVRQTSRGDSRVTRVGRFIRATSLDELPQLINVLRGEMSIVGPRPHALRTTAEGRELDEAVSDYAARHRVKPGITGWAQVNGLRGELDSIQKLENRVRYDIEYIDTWSLWLDVKIVLRTILLVFYDPRAY